jgi:hypothetical protein
MENRNTYLLAHGFKDSVSNQEVPLFFDTGSETSFLAAEIHAAGKDLIWSREKIPFPVHKGILPEGIQGILGLDFFQHTCIWWEGEYLSVYDAKSSVCQNPQAYFSTSLKLLVTKRIESYYYVKNVKNGKTFWSLVDTGTSLSFLPSEFEVGAESRGLKKVFHAGGRIQEIELFYTSGPLQFETSLGNSVSYFDFSFLRGISLEQLHLPREKDREGVWVIGLNLLGRAPLFWDFERNRIGLFSQTHEIK